MTPFVRRSSEPSGVSSKTQGHKGTRDKTLVAVRREDHGKQV